MVELTLWGADHCWVRFGPEPRAGDLQAWIYWHRGQGEIVALPGGSFDFVVNLTLGRGPTCVVERLRPLVAVELVDLGGQCLLAGELHRSKHWHMVAARLPRVLTHPAWSLRILASIQMTYPLAVRPAPAQERAWLAGAPALGDGSRRELPMERFPREPGLGNTAVSLPGVTAPPRDSSGRKQR